MVDKSTVTSNDILQAAMELKISKSKDYQGSGITEEQYFPYGDMSYHHMLNTKTLRIQSVMNQDSTNFESLEDSLIDLINYAAMWSAYIKNKG